jgi:hypothetical protein
VDPNISKNSTASTVSEQEAIRFSEVETGNYTGRKTDAALRMELKNPSDALKILMRSGELIPNQQASTCNSQSGSQSQVDTATYSPQLLTSTGNAGGASTISNSRAQMMQSTTAFDAYDLVQSGVLHPSIVPELLLVLVTNIFYIRVISVPNLAGTLVITIHTALSFQHTFWSDQPWNTSNVLTTSCSRFFSQLDLETYLTIH